MRDDPGLTPAQREFASHREAEPGRLSPVCGRFFYSRRGDCMRRWLVAPDGQVLEMVSFPLPPTPRDAPVATGPMPPG